MTHLELGIKLLNDASTFFEELGKQNPELNDQMQHNAGIYKQAAILLQQDPNGKLPDQPPQG